MRPRHQPPAAVDIPVYNRTLTVRPEELALALIERSRLERARDLDRGHRLVRQLRERIVALRARCALDAAWLIGSLAWGGFARRSDIDVVVRGAAADSVGELWAALTDALGVPVDVLRLESLPEAFRRRVLAEGVRLDEP